MNYTIKDDGLTAIISSTGAELQSLKTPDNMEYLWQGDPSIWNRRAPILFPIVGRLKDNTYFVDGHEYHLEGHGFARTSEFSVVKQNECEIEFSLRSSDQTKDVYPYDFLLLVRYSIVNGLLLVTYTVENTGNSEMLFSIGSHEAYRCPLIDGEKFEDYRLVFSDKEWIDSVEIVPPLIGNNTIPLFRNENILPLNYKDYEVDAIVLIGQKSSSVRLESTISGKGVEVNFAGWPMLGIWTKQAGAPFLCIEPWHGLGDRIGGSSKFEEKEGINRLQSGKIFECIHTIKCI